MVNENDIKWINKIDSDYIAYKVSKYYDEDLGGVVYTCILCDGENWSKEENGIGKTIQLAISRAVSFFPPKEENEESEEEIEAMKKKIAEWESRKNK